MTFKTYLTEAKKGISDLTGANKSVSRKENSKKFFVIRPWNDKEKNDTAYSHSIKQGDLKWDIVDNTKPDYKTSFPISDMIKYTGGDYKIAIEVKYALKAIQAGKWNPEL